AAAQVGRGPVGEADLEGRRARTVEVVAPDGATVLAAERLEGGDEADRRGAQGRGRADGEPAARLDRDARRVHRRLRAVEVHAVGADYRVVAPGGAVVERQSIVTDFSDRRTRDEVEPAAGVDRIRD